MSIRYETRQGKQGYDVRFRKEKLRERRAFPDEVRTPAARARYAEDRATALLREGKQKAEEPADTFAAFAPRWMRDYVAAEGLKPSTVDSYARLLRLHLTPVLGSLQLDAIGDLQIQRVKLRMAALSDKTRACALSLLSEMLKAAERWKEIDRAPEIDLPRFMQPEMEFYDVDAWERLIAGARAAGPMHLAAVLLGGDAGLRRGELVAFDQTDAGPQGVVVQRSEWRGKVGKPKGGKIRRVPMTNRLREAIAAVRHLRGARLLFRPGGEKVTITTLQSWLETACRRAGLEPSRNLHRLRHTFCSHLAMRGVPARVIQELAGHADLKTTMRYMHLSAGSAEAAVKLLEEPLPRGLSGDLAYK